jgi:hypothetical protein
MSGDREFGRGWWLEGGDSPELAPADDGARN